MAIAMKSGFCLVSTILRQVPVPRFNLKAVNRFVGSTSVSLLEFKPRNPKQKFTKGGREKEKKMQASDATAVVKQEHVFEEFPQENKNKQAFDSALSLFRQRNIHMRGHCEFILAALKRMKEFGVEEDLETYKRLLDLFPKGKMVSHNIFQAEGHFYPKQQDTCILILEQMQYHNVYPDKEAFELVMKTFGGWSHVSRKMRSLLYWMPKFKYANPYPVPRPFPRAELEIAKAAVQRMCQDPATDISVWFTEALPDAPEDTWIVSGQSIVQKDHIKEHSTEEPLYVDGPFRVWIGRKSLFYFMLNGEPNRKKYLDEIKPHDEWHTEEEFANWESKYNAEFPASRQKLMLMPTVHEQPDGTILAIAASGTTSKDSMACWITFLQRENPKLSDIPIVFRLKHLSGALMTIDDDEATRVKCCLNLADAPS